MMYEQTEHQTNHIGGEIFEQSENYDAVIAGGKRKKICNSPQSKAAVQISYSVWCRYMMKCHINIEKLEH